jgi:hypothetical protein
MVRTVETVAALATLMQVNFAATELVTTSKATIKTVAVVGMHVQAVTATRDNAFARQIKRCAQKEATLSVLTF